MDVRLDLDLLIAPYAREGSTLIDFPNQPREPVAPQRERVRVEGNYVFEAIAAGDFVELLQTPRMRMAKGFVGIGVEEHAVRDLVC